MQKEIHLEAKTSYWIEGYRELADEHFEYNQKYEIENCNSCSRTVLCDCQENLFGLRMNSQDTGRPKLSILARNGSNKQHLIPEKGAFLQQG